MKRKPSNSVIILLGSGGPESRNEEDLHHPARVWAEPEYEHLPLSRLLAEYQQHLRHRSKPASADTVIAYTKALTSLMASIEKAGEPTTLASLTPDAVERWLGERRATGQSPYGLSIQLTAIKTFSRKFVHK